MWATNGPQSLGMHLGVKLALRRPNGSHGEIDVVRPHQGSREIELRADRSSLMALLPMLLTFYPWVMQFRNYSSGLGGDSTATGDSSSTRVAADPDTHQDFQPTTKSSNMSFDDIVSQDIKENPVLIYMKGYPDAPRCGFSALAVRVLKQYDVPISARDILGDLKLKESVKAHTNWPTFPQIFIKGEFVGGSDIILDMHQAKGSA
uniref:Glutaredoxin domain-containing protein n=2 Tax=Oryza TaxID=4527 RepID=A0A0D3EPR0_9ORYZ